MQPKSQAEAGEATRMDDDDDDSDDDEGMTSLEARAVASHTLAKMEGEQRAASAGTSSAEA
eukprot:952292-Alexandrium_andersonii.AAC.1